MIPDERGLATDGFERQLFEASPTATLVVDESEVIVRANQRATELFGQSDDDLVGKTPGSLLRNVSDKEDPIVGDEQLGTGVFESGAPVFGLERRLDVPNGKRRWVILNAAPIPVPDGTPKYAIITMQEVTRSKRLEEQLPRDYMRHVEFRADRPAVPPSLRVDEGEYHFDVESVVSLADGTTVQYMGTADLSAGDLVTAVEEVPHYVDVRLLSTIEGYSRIEAHAEAATVAEVFQSLGGRARSIVISNDAVRFFGDLPADVELDAALTWIERFHSDVELVSVELVYSPDLLYEVVADALTERQFAAIEAAYFSGYFDTPRTTTGGQLADRFGVTRQTFNQHLRKGQKVVFEQLFEKTATDEVD